MTRVAIIGEPLIELSPDREPGCFRRNPGGDTLNTAVYLARLMGADASVTYITRLGLDPLSDWIVGSLATEGIDCSHIGRQGHMPPGLSMIENDDKGERSFAYWRGQTAARALLDGAFDEIAPLRAADAVFLSAVTLAIISPEARSLLVKALAEIAEGGGFIAFDLNYRPSLWPDEKTARAAIGAAVGAASLVLPSFDDVKTLWAVSTPQDAISLLESIGAKNVVLKTGGGPVYHRLAGGTRTYPLKRDPSPVDTTGAGDSFNAGYLASWFRHGDPDRAVAFGHALASQVVRHRGAIMPRDAMLFQYDKGQA